MELPYAFTNDTVLDADELQATLEALRDGLTQIRNANIVAQAGIDKSKLAQSGNLDRNSLQIVPATSSDTIGTGSGNGFLLPASLQTVARTNVRLASGQLAALCAIDVFVEEADDDSGTLPELNVLVDGVVFPGQAISIAVTATVNQYRLGNANPIANPGYPLADGSIIQYQLRRDGGGTTAFIRQVTVTEHVKMEHVAM